MITIIVLVILASVAINLSLGDNGIFNKAKYAKQKYLNSTDKEQRNLNELYGELLIASDGTINNISVETLQNLINITVDARIAAGVANPIGTIIAYSVNSVPQGYLKCEGQAVSRTEYSALFNIIGTTYGAGDGSTTFNVPDLRGEFLRGAGTATRNTGSGASVGTHQNPTKFLYTVYNWNGTVNFYGDSTENVSMQPTDRDKNVLEGTLYAKQVNTDKDFTASTGATYNKYTSRPTNTSVLYCIKY